MQASSVRITIGGHEEKIGYEVMRMFAEFAYQSNCMSARNFVDLMVTTCTRSCRKIDGMTGATERSYRACRITAPFDQTMLGIIHRIPECLEREGCKSLSRMLVESFASLVVACKAHFHYQSIFVRCLFFPVFFFSFFWRGLEVASVLGAFLFHFFFYLFYFFFDRWHFGGKGNINGRLEYSFKNDGILEVCRLLKRLEFAGGRKCGSSWNSTCTLALARKLWTKALVLGS
jgi:hypothetical protein